MSFKHTTRKTSRGGWKTPPPCGLGLNFLPSFYGGTKIFKAILMGYNTILLEEILD